MHMAIELNNRTKIMAGVVALAAVGAGAWFFFLADFLNEPPPKAAATKGAPADTSKQAGAAKQADGKAPADVPKQAADESKQAKAPASKPAAKPIPSNLDRLIAEVLENSGIKSQFQPFALETVLQAGGGGASAAADSRAVTESFERIYEPAKINEELAANLKKNLDVERMGRFLELLRQPVVLKVNSQETRATPPEAIRQYQEKARKDPPSPARVKLLQTIDDGTRTSEVALEMSAAIARTMVDTMLAELQKAGKNVPKEARQDVASQLTTMRNQARAQTRSVLHASYRNVSDEELAEYAKLIDTDTGRWGNEILATAIRPVLAGRSSAFGAEAGRLAMATRGGPAAKAPKAAEPMAKAEENSAEKPAAAPVKPAAVAPGYQRAPNIREAYSRYNDVITATVMRDRAAVKELLDDGKNPNARQRDGFTPLMVAVANGDADIAGMLLAKGADPNLRSQGGNTALSLARSRGASGGALVQMLQRGGAKE
jgi:hypothetical protein